MVAVVSTCVTEYGKLMMKDFFDRRLQAFLERRFHVRAGILDHPPETATPTIVNTCQGTGGPFYGGVTSDREVQLQHGPFPLQLVYSVHEDSCQIDRWEVRAEGVPKDAVEELTALCDPRQYDRWHHGEFLVPLIVIQCS